MSAAYNAPQPPSRKTNYTEAFLSVLTNEQQELCDYWHDEIDYLAPPGLQPAYVTAQNELPFARAVHRIVADTVSSDRYHVHHLVVARQQVETALQHYYATYPSMGILNDRQTAAKRSLQDSMLEVAHQVSHEYSEINICYALRRAFRDRRYQNATKAMFGLLTAYGQVVATGQSHE